VTFPLRAAAAVALALGLALPAGSAEARANDWTTVVTLHRAELLARKVPTTKHGPWRIRVRVDARRATTPGRGSAEVDKGAQVVVGPWHSHRMRPGTLSKIRTMRMPRGSAYSFSAGLETDTTGVGSAGGVSGISRC